MSMSSRVGAGASRSLLSAWLLLATQAPPVTAQDAIKPDSEWTPISSYELEPGMARIVMVEQTGPDLLVRSKYSTGITEVQDSHDFRFGTEVVYLENNTSSIIVVDLSARPNGSGLAATFNVAEVDASDPRARELASRLMRAARLREASPYSNDAALALWDMVPEIGTDSPLYLVAAMQRIQALMSVFNYQAALDAVAALRAATVTDEESAVHLDWIAAISHWQLRDIDGALAEFSTIQERLERRPEIRSTGQLLDRLNILANHGAVFVNAGVRVGNAEQMRRGADMIDQALREATPYPDYRLLGILHNYVSGYSTMLYNRNDPDGRNALELAEHFYELAGDLHSLADMKNNKAYSLLGLGRIGEAQGLYREALSLSKQTGDSYGYSFFLARLASTYMSTGDLARSEYLYRESISLMQSLGFEAVARPNEIQLGMVYSLRGNHEQAIRHFLSLLGRINTDEWVEERLQIHTELARSYLQSGDIPAAKQHAETAAAIAPNVNKLELRLENKVLEADLLIATGQYEMAAELLTGTLAELENEQQELTQQLELLRLLADVQFSLQDYEASLRTGRQANLLVDSTRNQLDIANLGPAWSAKSSAVTRQHIDHLLSLYENSNEPAYLDEAFRYLQQYRAVNLRQARALSSLQGREMSTPETDELLKAWQDMVDANQALLAASIRKESTTDLEQALVGRQEAYRLLNTSITPAALAGELQVITLSDVQRVLPSGAVALSFLLGKQASWRISIDRTSVTVRKLPGSVELNTMVAAFVAGNQPGSRIDPAEFAQLGDWLLPSLADGHSLVLIEPDGVLDTVPFAALPVRVDADQPWQVAVDRFSMLQTSSISLYFGSDQGPADTNDERASIAILADPVFSRLESPPFPVLDHGYADWRGGLEALPYTRIEAQSISKHFEPGSSIVLTGDAATAASLFSPRSRSASILHIATHGFADAANPSSAGLALSPDASNKSGLLTAEEIGTQFFSNRLVVISGCETAQGQLLAGEGMMSIARVFVAQGADSVLATLWPISDRATAQFMDKFYSALKESNDIPAALKTAQLQMSRSADYRHPYYWSGFVLNAASPDVFGETSGTR